MLIIVFKVLKGKSARKRSFGRHRRRWWVNIEMDIKDIGYEGTGWVHLARGPDRDRWRLLVNTAMNLRVP
jgi:hypothetical protein